MEEIASKTILAAAGDALLQTELYCAMDRVAFTAPRLLFAIPAANVHIVVSYIIKGKRFC